MKVLSYFRYHKNNLWLRKQNLLSHTIFLWDSCGISLKAQKLWWSGLQSTIFNRKFLKTFNKIPQHNLWGEVLKWRGIVWQSVLPLISGNLNNWVLISSKLDFSLKMVKKNTCYTSSKVSVPRVQKKTPCQNSVLLIIMQYWILLLQVRIYNTYLQRR